MKRTYTAPTRAVHRHLDCQSFAGPTAIRPKAVALRTARRSDRVPSRHPDQAYRGVKAVLLAPTDAERMFGHRVLYASRCVTEVLSVADSVYMKVRFQ
jgi:hypothetical protein